MGHTGRKDSGGKRGKNRRIWGFLAALWLVAACLAACAGTGHEKAVEDKGQVIPVTETDVRQTDPEPTQEKTREEEISRESDTDPEEKLSQESDTDPEEKLSRESDTDPEENLSQEEGPGLEESGHYTSKEEVALYLHLYGRLPDNYLTKKEAESLGWDSRAGNLWEVAPGMSIGGSRFGNYEKALPEKDGRKYYECDIDYEGGYRGAKRIIYSDDGLIFYTEDHYKTFEQLYGQ